MRTNERVTKNRDARWNREKFPRHARWFILRESYWRNFRKFEIVIHRLCVCAYVWTRRHSYFRSRDVGLAAVYSRRLIERAWIIRDVNRNVNIVLCRAARLDFSSINIFPRITRFWNCVLHLRSQSLSMHVATRLQLPPYTLALRTRAPN